MDEKLVAPFLEAIKAFGSAGGVLFFYLWYREQQERKECQKAHSLLLEQTLKVVHEVSSTSASLKDAVVELTRATQTSASTISSMIRASKRVQP